MSSKVRDTARLHPQTVANYGQHLKRQTRTSSLRMQTQVTRVNLDVWRTALRLAEGDATRIVVHSPTEVIVVNHSKRKKF
jgi:hypothetical protein